MAHVSVSSYILEQDRRKPILFLQKTAKRKGVRF